MNFMCAVYKITVVYWKKEGLNCCYILLFFLPTNGIQYILFTECFINELFQPFNTLINNKIFPGNAV